MIRDLVAEELVLRLEKPMGTPDGDRIRVHWTGRSNARQPGAVLAPYLEAVADAAGSESRFIEFHFESLEYVNSATVLVIMQVIQALRRKHIRLVILYDDASSWQKTNFDVLRHMERGDGLLTVRSISGEGRTAR